MDYSPPGFSVHRDSLGRTLEWVAMPSSRGSSQPRDPALQAYSLLTESPGKPNTVEVTNIFKGLDVVDTVPEELWTEVCNTVHEAVIKTIPKKKKCKKVKMGVGGGRPNS